MAKLKDIINEGFSVVGGVVSTPALGTSHIGLTDIAEDIYGTQEKVSAKEVKEAMNQFSDFSKVLQKEENMKQIAETLSQIANTAKTYTLSETDDWFDKVTVNRNMKELNGLAGSFSKVATEAQAMQERMAGLYEDMGHIINRYYDISEVEEASKSYRHEPDHEDEGAVDEGRKEEYKKFFDAALEKFGASSPADLDDEKKKEFFNYIDKEWSGSNESD